MLRMRAGLLLFALVAVAFAGCTSTDPAPEAVGMTAGLEPGMNWTHAGFAAAADVEFTIDDAWTGVPVVDDICVEECHVVLHDITEAFDAGVLYEAEAVLSAESLYTPLGFLSFNMDFVSDGGWVLDQDWEYGEQTVTVTAFVSAPEGATLSLEVDANFFRDGTTAPYSIAVQASPAAQPFADGVPVAVALDAGTTSIAIWPVTPAGAVHVLDADDLDLGVFPLSDGVILNVTQAAPGDEWVLVFHGVAPGTAVQVAQPVDAAPPLLRTMRIEEVVGPTTAVDGAGPVTWSFDPGRAPLSIGFQVGRPSSLTDWWLTDQASVTILGPDGSAVIDDYGFNCLACVGWIRHVEESTMPLLAGEYAVEFSSRESRNLQVAEVYTLYVR